LAEKSKILCNFFDFGLFLAVFGQNASKALQAFIFQSSYPTHQKLDFLL
jgi:hypothetical protein